MTQNTKWTKGFQKLLNERFGTSLEITGKNDPATQAAIKAIQAVAGLPQTGMADKRTEQFIRGFKTAELKGSGTASGPSPASVSFTPGEPLKMVPQAREIDTSRIAEYRPNTAPEMMPPMPRLRPRAEPMGPPPPEPPKPVSAGMYGFPWGKSYDNLGDMAVDYGRGAVDAIGGMFHQEEPPPQIGTVVPVSKFGSFDERFNQSGPMPQVSTPQLGPKSRMEFMREFDPTAPIEDPSGAEMTDTRTEPDMRQTVADVLNWLYEHRRGGAYDRPPDPAIAEREREAARVERERFEAERLADEERRREFYGGLAQENNRELLRWARIKQGLRGPR